MTYLSTAMAMRKPAEETVNRLASQGYDYDISRAACRELERRYSNKNIEGIRHAVMVALSRMENK